MSRHRRIVFSGGPGAGKTTVLLRLQQSGYATVPEVARQIIADRMANGLSPRPGPVKFAEAILERDIQHYNGASDELTFFDRGVLDALVMLRNCDALADGVCDEMVARFRYSSPVFIFPPWAEIYENDAQRDQSFEEASEIFSTITAWYREWDYDVSLVPFGTVDQRCKYVLDTLGQPV